MLANHETLRAHKARGSNPTLGIPDDESRRPGLGCPQPQVIRTADRRRPRRGQLGGDVECSSSAARPTASAAWRGSSSSTRSPTSPNGSCPASRPPPGPAWTGLSTPSGARSPSPSPTAPTPAPTAGKRRPASTSMSTTGAPCSTRSPSRRRFALLPPCIADAAQQAQRTDAESPRRLRKSSIVLCVSEGYCPDTGRTYICIRCRLFANKHRPTLPVGGPVRGRPSETGRRPL